MFRVIDHNNTGIIHIDQVNHYLDKLDTTQRLMLIQQRKEQQLQPTQKHFQRKANQVKSKPAVLQPERI